MTALWLVLSPPWEMGPPALTLSPNGPPSALALPTRVLESTAEAAEETATGSAALEVLAAPGAAWPVPRERMTEGTQTAFDPKAR